MDEVYRRQVAQSVDADAENASLEELEAAAAIYDRMIADRHTCDRCGEQVYSEPLAEIVEKSTGCRMIVCANYCYSSATDDIA